MHFIFRNFHTLYKFTQYEQQNVQVICQHKFFQREIFTKYHKLKVFFIQISQKRGFPLATQVTLANLKTVQRPSRYRHLPNRIWCRGLKIMTSQRKTPGPQRAQAKTSLGYKKSLVKILSKVQIPPFVLELRLGRSLLRRYFGTVHRNGWGEK